MSLKKPRAGEVSVLAESFGRALVEQAFYYKDASGNERREVFSLWQYLKTSPALIFPITSERQVVAIRQFRHGSNDFVFEIPGGVPSDARSARDTAEIELLEETGFQAAEIIDIGSRFWSDSATHNLQFSAFVGLDCRKVRNANPDANEILETVLVPLEEWFAKIGKFEINDARIITLSHLALPHVGGRIEF